MIQITGATHNTLFKRECALDVLLLNNTYTTVDFCDNVGSTKISTLPSNHTQSIIVVRHVSVVQCRMQRSEMKNKTFASPNTCTHLHSTMCCTRWYICHLCISICEWNHCRLIGTVLLTHFNLRICQTILWNDDKSQSIFSLHWSLIVFALPRILSKFYCFTSFTGMFNSVIILLFGCAFISPPKYSIQTKITKHFCRHCCCIRLNYKWSN